MPLIDTALPGGDAFARLRDGAAAAGVLSPVVAVMVQMLPPIDARTAGKHFHASTTRTMAASAGCGPIVVKDLSDRAGLAAAGRLWRRLRLVTLRGVASQPIDQLPETFDRDRQLGRDDGWSDRLAALGDATGHATFTFRHGSPLTQVPHSARRPVEAVLVDA